MARRHSKHRRRPPRPAGRAVTPTQTPPPALVPARFAYRLRPVESMALVVLAAAGLAGFAGIADRYTYYRHHVYVPLILTAIVLVAVFVLERDWLRRTVRSSVRFSGVGLLAPLLWAFVRFGALMPILALQGMTTWRLGLGSIFPPSLVATFATGLLYGPLAGMLVCIGHCWSGVGVALIVRRPEKR